MQQRYNVKARASKKWSCTTCETACRKQYEFDRHNASERHLNNVAKATPGIVKKYYCAVCKYSAAKASHVETHNAGKRHLERVAEAESSSRSTME